MEQPKKEMSAPVAIGVLTLICATLVGLCWISGTVVTNIINTIWGG